jgi:hypothetical protein
VGDSVIRHATARTGRLLAAVAVLAIGVLTLAVSAPVASADSNYPVHKPPTTSVGGDHFPQPGKDLICVDGYAPGSTVLIHRGGADGSVVGTIHTDKNGHGCTKIPVTKGCHPYTATGTDAQGRPRHSAARVCVEGEHADRRTHSSSLPFTGTEIAGAIILGLILIVAGALVIVGARHRRSSQPA